MKRITIGIPVEYGFHEVKKFIYSGFAQRLSAEFNIVWLALRKESVEFDEVLASAGFPIVYIDQSSLPNISLKVEKLDRMVRNSWMLNMGIGSFHNYRKIQRRTLKSFIFGNSLFKNLVSNIVLREVKKYYFNDQLAVLFYENNIDAVFSTSCNSTFSKYIFVTAFHQNIDSWYLINSWKDLYVDNSISFDFLKGIFVWSDEMKQDYRNHIPHLNPSIFHVTGNPSFDAIVTARPVYSRTHYAEKYSISEDAQWLYYTMMPPGLVNDELDTIIAVANELSKHWSAKEKVIMIRRNPNHHKNEFSSVVLPYNVVLTEHFIVYDKVKDMIVQSAEGELEWIDLLNYTAINLSAPSTVTLEFLIKGKAVINIGFDHTGQHDHRIDQHFGAGFYKPLFLKKEIFSCMDLKDLKENIDAADRLVVNKEILPSTEASLKIESILSDYYYSPIEQ
jgi:hypothetical protein